MNLKQQKRYVKKQIQDIEGAIAVHSSCLDFDNLEEEERKHRLGAISELTIDLEAYRFYLLHLTKLSDSNTKERNLNDY